MFVTFKFDISAGQNFTTDQSAQSIHFLVSAF